MTTANKTAPRALAILKLPKTVSALVTYAQGIVTAMTSNPSFPTSVPSIRRCRPRSPRCRAQRRPRSRG